MNRANLIRCSITAILMATFPCLQAYAQRNRAGNDAIPRPGTLLPIVSAYDSQGEKFSTASLRGSYTVLVFGCLT